ncbi:MAG: M20 family metallopeptidase [Bacteroidales bacterium]|nr:amidohydrolase [Lentimicrobiaceae bacterium]MDD5695112.1 M20 family metallopeptidase [Bacteroidales bacterium]
MENLPDRIRALASSHYQDTVAIRRYFHTHPELSCHEQGTADYIAEKLTGYGIPFTRNVAGTGLVALIHGGGKGEKVIALRADMDALPIQEENDVPYRSQVPGVMHACGHDVHLASLLGAARILQSLASQLKGTVKLLFQPSEETYPGGAIRMIEEGVLENPHVDSIFGLHVDPSLDAGTVGMKPGKYMASSDEFYVTIRGRGGHAATPDLNIDPIVISAHVILALQHITSRLAPPVLPTVVSVGKVLANGRVNIIPDEVRLEGIIRTFDNAWREKIHGHLTHIVTSVTASLGGTCQVNIAPGYPFLVNDDLLTARVKHHSIAYLGKENVRDLEMRMTSEDFAYYSHAVPGCFYRLGIRNESRGIVSNLHTSTFDVDEKCLETGAGLMAWIAINELEHR